MMLRLLLTTLLIYGVHSKESIYDLLSNVGCDSFAGLLQSTGYMYSLGDDHKGPYTVFAPADAAFNNLPPKIQKIFDFGNWELMFDIVSYHITNDVYLIASMQNNGLYDTMLENSQLRFNKYPQITTISGANITSADNTATNGIIHVIDQVLYRFPEASTPQLVDEHVHLTTMALLIDKGGLHDVLKGQNLTLFVPSDDAFDAAPKDFLNGLLANDTAIANFMENLMVSSVYFSSDLMDGQDLFTPLGNRIKINVSQGNVTVNGSIVTTPDLITMNGVVHIINKII